MEEKVVGEFPADGEFVGGVALYALEGAATGQFRDIKEGCVGAWVAE